jgi:signal transduction histidine kinase
MIQLSRLVTEVLGIAGSAPGRAAVHTSLGQLLCREFSAEGWAFYRRRPDSSLSLVDSEGAAGPDWPPSLSVSLPGGPPVSLPASCTCIPLDEEEERDGCFLLRHATPVGRPLLDPGSLDILSASIRHMLRQGDILARSGIFCRGHEVLSTISRRLADSLEPSRFLVEVTAALHDELHAAAGCVHLDHPSWAEAGLPRLTTFPEELSTSGEDLSFFRYPLRCQGSSLGTLCIHLPASRLPDLPLRGAFLPGGIGFLEAVAGEIALRAMHVILHLQATRLIEERQQRLQELWILQETNNALRGTLKVNRILKMILAGATADTGLGFNRAALFLLNRKTNLLQGMLGVGPDTAEDARTIWKSLAAHSGLSLARQIEMYADNQPPGSRFDSLVRSIRIPVHDDAGALATCVLSRTTLRFAAGENPPPEPEISEKLNMTEFAATPIVARDQIFGLVVVDNLFDGKSISDEDLRLLSMFAAQAGLAIANAKELRAHKQAAEELRHARDMLLQTERLAALGEIAASLAHEIRNPLVTIGGFARRLRNKLGDDDSAGKYAGIIASEVKRLEEFLEEVLLFGKDRQPNLQPVAVNELLSSVTQLLSDSFAESDISLVRDLAVDLPAVPADSNQMRQVLINLFTNAMEAMPGGGDIFVTSRFQKQPNQAVVLTVTDTGGGVEPEVLGNIFNPFYTTKSGGHGLGLALTQRIVTAHSGSLSVRNLPGQGLSFQVTLPLQPVPGFLNGSAHADNNERRKNE